MMMSLQSLPFVLLSLSVCSIIFISSPLVDAFSISKQSLPQQKQVQRVSLQQQQSQYHSQKWNSRVETSSSVLFSKSDKQQLGLLTFDLDDTLYPIAAVEQEANEAFVKSMESYGFGDENLQASDIVSTAQAIRDEHTDDASLTHLDLRYMAIRREMENVVYRRKVNACAEDWATTVDALSNLVKENSKKWAKAAVNENMVRAVSTAWEMERHHSAERHLFPEVLDALKSIKEEHPNAIIGAVTDGRSNPLYMTFTLGQYFDFRCSWEDDQGKRQKFFQQLETTDGDADQLSWIYDEARYQYGVMRDATKAMAKPLQYPATYDDLAWIHVGDDLAFDIGGSKACGAKTIYTSLDYDKYGQTARRLYDSLSTKDSDTMVLDSAAEDAAWSTRTKKELTKRLQMATMAAKSQVDTEIQFISRLPNAINEILSDNN